MSVALFFDPSDRELLELMNPVLTGQRSYKTLRNLFDPYLHPRGIKELAAPASLRIACAVFDLLGTLEGGHPEERLRALRAVREEVLHNGAPSLRNNTARGNAAVIDAQVPLKEMFGYIGGLRALSQGRAQYSMQFDHYREAAASERAALTLA